MYVAHSHNRKTCGKSDVYQQKPTKIDFGKKKNPTQSITKDWSKITSPLVKKEPDSLMAFTQVLYPIFKGQVISMCALNHAGPQERKLK